jgi:hypothetical protein
MLASNRLAHLNRGIPAAEKSKTESDLKKL